MIREALKPTTDLNPYDLVERIMRDNRAADEAHIKRLVRRALLGPDKDYLDAFIDFTTSRCFANYCARQEARAASTPQQRATYTPTLASSAPLPRTSVAAAPARPTPTVADFDRARSRGRDRFTQNREAIEQMRFANGKGVLEQTVADAQSYGGWFAAIIRALPKHAKTTDLLGKHLTLEQVAKLRTFDVTT